MQKPVLLTLGLEHVKQTKHILGQVAFLRRAEMPYIQHIIIMMFYSLLLCTCE